MIHHHKINTLALWLARSSLRPPSQAILVKGPYQLSSSVVLPHGFPLFCRLQRSVVPCHRQVQHHREGSVPTLKLSCTTPWVSTILPSSTRSGPMSPTSVTSSWRVRTNSQTQLYYPMGFHYSAVFNAQWSHVTDKCNIMSPLDPVQPRVTSCPRWILSNTDGWIMLMVEPESTSAIIGIPFASILWYKLPWQSLFKIISCSNDPLTRSAAESRVPDVVTESFPALEYLTQLPLVGSFHCHSLSGYLDCHSQSDVAAPDSLV